MKIEELKNKVAFIIPGHNEELVIGNTIKSILNITTAKNIYVVSDGSTDQTYAVAKELTENVIDLSPNVGKAKALNTAIETFNLTENYDFIMVVDADCHVDENFLNEAIKVFAKDKKKELACVIGKVVGKDTNWVTSYRIWEYEVAQSIHKAAQAHLNTIIVCPGPSTIYRASVFEKIKIPTGTLTEDMDLTFAIHRNKLGKIAYCGSAMVMTQDPKTLKDFIKQNDRWHTGFWQCVKKHNMPWGGQAIDAEIALLATEGLFNGTLVIILITLLPFIILSEPGKLYIPILFDFLFFIIPTLILAASKRNTWGIFKYIPHFYLLRFVSSFIFIKSFLKVIVGIDLQMGWNKVLRYHFGHHPQTKSEPQISGKEALN